MIEESAISAVSELAAERDVATDHDGRTVLDIAVLICEDDNFQRLVLKGLFESANKADDT